ncbi:hypothetical protein ACLESO_43765 [Pyxidicoccus sp. 3LG]
MRFFEVNTAAPPDVDMGSRLPLRFSQRPLLGQAVYPVLILTWFCVIPLAFVLDQQDPFAEFMSSWWLLFVFILGGLLGVGGLLSCILTRLHVEVTASQVHQRVGGILRQETWSEPLRNYACLRTERRHHPDWLMSQDEFGIHLSHAKDESRSIVLFWGRSQRRFEERLRHYADLLDLEVDVEPRAEEVEEEPLLLRSGS